MAVTVKENINQDIRMEEPKDILVEPPPQPETPREGENEAATTARNLRDKLEFFPHTEISKMSFRDITELAKVRT